MVAGRLLEVVGNGDPREMAAQADRPAPEPPSKPGAGTGGRTELGLPSRTRPWRGPRGNPGPAAFFYFLPATHTMKLGSTSRGSSTGLTYTRPRWSTASGALS